MRGQSLPGARRFPYSSRSLRREWVARLAPLREEGSQGNYEARERTNLRASESAPTIPESKKMRHGESSLRCFGVGDGWPCTDRNHSSFLYRLGRTTLLVDCGEGASGRYKSTSLPYDLVDRVFISHLHADHVAGLFMFLQGLWLEQRTRDLRIHLPAGGIEPLTKMLNAMFLFPELLRFRLKLEPLHQAKPTVVDGVRVTPYRTSHLDRLRKAYGKQYKQEFEAFCFLIETGEMRIGHTADLGRPEDLGPLVRQPLDLLVCELAHFRAEDLFRYLNGRDIGKIVFVHVARPYWRDLKNTRALAAKLLPKIPFVFAKDGDEVNLKKPRPVQR